MIRIIVDLPGAGDRHCGSCPMLTGGAADRATACHIFGALNREPVPEDLVDPLLRAGDCHGAQTFGGQTWQPVKVVALPMMGPEEDEEEPVPETDPAPAVVVLGSAVMCAPRARESER